MLKNTILTLLISFVLQYRAQAQANIPQPPASIWTAHWVAHPTAPPKAYGVYHFRNTFNIATKPDSFIIHVSADNRYRLFVNGKPVGFGPARGDLQHWRYETYDIAPYLNTGTNTLAATVWNFADHIPLAQVTLHTAFIVQGQTNKESMVNTGEAVWKVIKNEAYQPIVVNGKMVRGYYAAGSCDSVTAALYPWGWEENGYSDKNWQTARKVAKSTPYINYGYGDSRLLVKREIPMMEEKKERINKVDRVNTGRVDAGFIKGTQALQIPANTHQTILLDQTYLTVGYPEIMVSGGKGSKIKITYAEALYEKSGEKGNRNITQNKEIAGFYDVFLPDGEPNRLFRPLWTRTYRFIELDIQTGDQALTIHDYYNIFTAYPFKQTATFQANDPSYARIWDIGWRTARLCAGETYYDCPYYEQMQYVGDTRIQALISLYNTDDDRLVRNAIAQFDQSRIPDGLTLSRYPTAENQVIPPFSLYWIAMVYDYHIHRNDTVFVKQFLPGIQSVLSWFENKIDKNGLLGSMNWWNFVDWAPQYNRGVPDGVYKGQSSILSLQYVYALNYAAELFAFYGKTAESQKYSQLAQVIKKAVMLHCYDADQKLIAETPEKKQFSQHANIMAVLTDAIPASEQKAVIQKVMVDKSLVQTTIYYKFYLVQALQKVGLADQYNAILSIWRDMIADGLTTFPESEPEIKPRSDCHAWSASPNYDFLATVCGIRPASPLFRTVTIEPAFGTLKELTASMPHYLGPIKLNLKKNKNKIEGQIALPNGLRGQFRWNGQTIKLEGGTQKIRL